VGQARVAAARGQGLSLWTTLVRRSPTPTLLIEYAWWLRAAGRPSEADIALNWAAAALDLFTANGGADDLTAAELAIARGDAASAVHRAKLEWGRRRHADVADALAWALHLAGRDGEALGYARLANAPGARDATRAYHLGMIELALGERTAARRNLARAIEYNPRFSPVDGRLAAQTLAKLGGAL
jgi:tetratricopeptide (TPR) repeat protein